MADDIDQAGRGGNLSAPSVRPPPPTPSKSPGDSLEEEEEEEACPLPGLVVSIAPWHGIAQWHCRRCCHWGAGQAPQ